MHLWAAAFGTEEHHLFLKIEFHYLADNSRRHLCLSGRVTGRVSIVSSRKITTFGKHVFNITYLNALLSKLRSQMNVHSENLNSRRYQ